MFEKCMCRLLVCRISASAARSVSMVASNSIRLLGEKAFRFSTVFSGSKNDKLDASCPCAFLCWKDISDCSIQTLADGLLSFECAEFECAQFLFALLAIGTSHMKSSSWKWQIKEKCSLPTTYSTQRTKNYDRRSTFDGSGGGAGVGSLFHFNFSIAIHSITLCAVRTKQAIPPATPIPFKDRALAHQSRTLTRHTHTRTRHLTHDNAL